MKECFADFGGNALADRAHTEVALAVFVDNRAFAQIGLVEVCTDEIGAAEAAPSHIGAPETGFGEIGAFGVGTVEARRIELGAGEIRFGEDGAREIRVRQVARRKVQPAQIAEREHRARTAHPSGIEHFVAGGRCGHVLLSQPGGSGWSGIRHVRMRPVIGLAPVLPLANIGSALSNV